MPDDSSNKPKAPYLPYTTFRNFLSSLKAGAIPLRIDKTLMVGHSGSIQSWLISALKFFTLIDENSKPTDDLTLLVEGEGDAKKAAWKRVFERGYAPIIAELDLQRATLGQLNEQFGKDFSVETVRKCQSFFAAAAEDAGIALADQLKPRARTSGPRKIRKNRVPSTAPSEAHTDPVIQNGQNNGAAGSGAVGAGAGSSATATLLLSPDGVRFVRLTAPPTVTSAELTRIQSWLGFQLIVEPSAK